MRTKPKKHSHLIPEFHFEDFLQILIGAGVLAIPVGFTQETWELGEKLPSLNIGLIALISVLFISAFIYHHYYHKRLERHFPDFLERLYKNVNVQRLGLIGVVKINTDDLWMKMRVFRSSKINPFTKCHIFLKPMRMCYGLKDEFKNNVAQCLDRQINLDCEGFQFLKYEEEADEKNKDN